MPSDSSAPAPFLLTSAARRERAPQREGAAGGPTAGMGRGRARPPPAAQPLEAKELTVAARAADRKGGGGATAPSTRARQQSRALRRAGTATGPAGGANAASG